MNKKGSYIFAVDLNTYYLEKLAITDRGGTEDDQKVLPYGSKFCLNCTLTVRKMTIVCEPFNHGNAL